MEPNYNRNDRLKYVNGKWLKTGFTTGTCAAAASKAAALMILTGKITDGIELKWNSYSHVFKTEDCSLKDNEASCAVRKDSGDDPDITNGILIYSKVRISKAAGPDCGIKGRPLRGENAFSELYVNIRGGTGVGTVTKPGLSCPVGSAAINPGPLRMIENAVREVFESGFSPACSACGGAGSLNIDVTISVPEGAEIAKKTFNPELGITGGISILGTTGIVEPMSGSAITEAIHSEIRVKSRSPGSSSERTLIFVPGSIGMSFARDALNADAGAIIKCGNYIGKALDFCREEGVRGIVIAGNIGKLVKLSGGIFNTHSGESDSRMDIVIRGALKAGADLKTLLLLDECVTTDAAVGILKDSGILDAVMDILAERAYFYVRRRLADDSVKLGIIFVSNSKQILAQKGNIAIQC